MTQVLEQEPETTKPEAMFDDPSLVRTWKHDPDVPPLFIEPATDALKDYPAFIDWVQANRPALDKLLVEHGGIVFRGFPVSDAEGFNGFVSLYELYAGDYAGGATPRGKIAGNVFEATQLAGPLKLPLHQEMAYIRDMPGRVVFFCRQPAERGGETTIADMRRLTNSLPADLKQKLHEKSVVGVRNFVAPFDNEHEAPRDHPDQRSWKFAFYTENKDEVEKACEAKQMEAVWNEDGSLAVRNTLSAFTRHPVTGEEVYRSNVHMNVKLNYSSDLPEERRKRLEEMFANQKYPTGYSFDDGTSLTPEEYATFDKLFAEGELAWDWQAGDIMLLDNLLVAHGRNPFSGGGRDVQVALLA